MKNKKIGNIFGNPSVTITPANNTKLIVTEKKVEPDEIWIIYKEWGNGFEIDGYEVTKEKAMEKLTRLGGDNVEIMDGDDVIANNKYWRAQRISKIDYAFFER